MNTEQENLKEIIESCPIKLNISEELFGLISISHVELLLKVISTLTLAIFKTENITEDDKKMCFYMEQLTNIFNDLLIDENTVLLLSKEELEILFSDLNSNNS